ncbi:GNAT family N-acetyltransferase [Streptomyces sp. NPDC091265]|uniref:GNAT family N-acetyltransferase n=1 Tax=unclassified Streptomyces TaxID=2593676 RepID=UPI00344C0ED6
MDDLPPEALDLLRSTGTLYDTPEWLRYCEASSGGLLRHITLQDGRGRSVGLATVRIVRDEKVMSLYNLRSLLDGLPSDPAAEAGEPPLFPSAVAAVSGAHCVLLPDPAADDASRAAQRGALARAVVALAAAEGCTATGFLYLTADAAQDVAAALGDGAGTPFLVAAQTQLTGGWPDFEGYLATLRSPRRNKIRRERKQFAESGITTRVLYGTQELGEATARLQVGLRERYGAAGTVESVMRDYAHLSAHVDDRVRVFLCEREGRPIGMSLALADGDRLHVRLAGFDYATAGADFAYFNAVYYEPILWGIEHGVTHYSFGTGTYAAKLTRGCVPVPLYGVVQWPEPLRERAARHLAGQETALRAQLGLPSPGGSDLREGAQR